AFALAKASDDLHLWSDAWNQFEKGNVLAKQRQTWERDRWSDFVKHKLHSPSLPQDALGSDRQPVFIVGNLRSGTTLMETLLSGHIKTVPRGELNYLAEIAKLHPETNDIGPTLATRLASDYWTQLRLDGPEDHFYIDKNPLNFRYLDLLFRLFPDARVIHITRDGRDSCLSCFTQLFEHTDAAFSNSLDSLVSFYAGYKKLMAKWEGTYGKQIHSIAYEELIDSPTAGVKGAIEFLGAEYDEASMGTNDDMRPVRTASVWQARREVHRNSLDRWRNYHEFSPSFFDQLAQIDNQYRVTLKR
ncbi:MAG: hypothetical protein ACI9GW_001365, partial [Halieaceae bacterium]